MVPHDSWGISWNDSWDTLKDNFYPPKDCIFRVFEMDPKEIKIVLLGQDPYHGPGQAHGLSFSVPDGQVIPASLKNIFKELVLEFPERNYKFTSGNLERWFYEEKIFLLNSALTVEHGKPGSHLKLWSCFTDDIIRYLNKNSNCIFLFMGNYAKKKVKLVDEHRFVTCVHPSPLSANRGFFNSGIFKKTEALLGQNINWQN